MSRRMATVVLGAPTATAQTACSSAAPTALSSDGYPSACTYVIQQYDNRPLFLYARVSGSRVSILNPKHLKLQTYTQVMWAADCLEVVALQSCAGSGALRESVLLRLGPAHPLNVAQLLGDRSGSGAGLVVMQYSGAPRAASAAAEAAAAVAAGGAALISSLRFPSPGFFLPHATAGGSTGSTVVGSSGGDGAGSSSSSGASSSFSSEVLRFMAAQVAAPRGAARRSQRRASAAALAAAAGSSPVGPSAVALWGAAGTAGPASAGATSPGPSPTAAAAPLSTHASAGFAVTGAAGTSGTPHAPSPASTSADAPHPTHPLRAPPSPHTNPHRGPCHAPSPLPPQLAPCGPPLAHHHFVALRPAPPTRAHPLAGLWKGVYGPHGVEVVAVGYDCSGHAAKIVGHKATGDNNVPAGQVRAARCVCAVGALVCPTCACAWVGGWGCDGLGVSPCMEELGICVPAAVGLACSGSNACLGSHRKEGLWWGDGGVRHSADPLCRRSGALMSACVQCTCAQHTP